MVEALKREIEALRAENRALKEALAAGDLEEARQRLASVIAMTRVTVEGSGDTEG